MSNIVAWDKVLDSYKKDDIRLFLNAEIGLRPFIKKASNPEAKSELYRVERAHDVSKIRVLLRRALKRRNITV